MAQRNFRGVGAGKTKLRGGDCDGRGPEGLPKGPGKGSDGGGFLGDGEWGRGGILVLKLRTL